MPQAKVLQAMRLSRADDGGHIVTHHHFEGKTETHRFKRSSGAIQHILNNIDRLEPAGGSPQIEEQEESQPDSWMGGRPASFDYGSARIGSIQGRRT